MRHLAAVCFCLFSLAAVAAPVTPFNAHNSTHVFQKNQYGGIQQVVAKDPKDTDLIATIRAWLEAEAVAFGKGDYGKGMPGVQGLQYLRAIKPSQISIIYRNVPAGAAIDYEGNDAAAVDAIHKWFDAQLDDSTDASSR